MHYLIIIGAAILVPLTLYKLLQPAAFSESTKKQILAVERISSFMVSSYVLLYALMLLFPLIRSIINIFSFNLSGMFMLLSMILYSFTILLLNPFSITLFRQYFKDKLTSEANRNISVFILISTLLITAFTVAINTK
jgi:hypothetical protein